MPEQDYFSQFKPHDDQFYDYDAALKAGAKPDASGHWPSDFKKSGHPNEIVGGFNTRTGLPEKGHQLITNPDELVKLGWEPKTALELSRKYSNEQSDDFFNQFESVSNDNIKPINENEPDSWMKGFINSVTSGDALSAGLSGAKGFLKGSFDFPSTLKGIGQSIASKFSEKDQPQLSEQELQDAVIQLHNTPKESFLDQAARNPEEFGHDLGMMTGQPLVTAGMFKAAPTATRLSGYPVELAGRTMRRYAPITGMPGGYFLGRNMRMVERLAGKGIESVGKMMKRVGANEPTTENMPTIADGEEIVPPLRGQEPKNYKVIRNEELTPNKPKFRTNGDDTFTNLETGEVLDSKGQSIVEINKKPVTPTIDKNSPFFTRNRPSHPMDIIKNERGAINIKRGVDDPRNTLTPGPVGESGRTFLRNTKGRISQLLKGDSLKEADIPANAQQFFDEILAPHRINTAIEEIDSAIKQFKSGYASDRVPGQIQELNAAIKWAEDYKSYLNDKTIPIRQRYFDMVKDIIDYKIDKNP